MNDEPIRALLIEDDPGDVDILRELLSENQNVRTVLEPVQTLKEGISRIADDRFDLILLDLSLPDSQGLQTFFSVHNAAKETPVIILTGFDDETTAFEAIKRGAQDFLVKGRVDPGVLMRAFVCAIEREKINRRLKATTDELKVANSRLEMLTMLDPMTDLYNRRGLQTVLSREIHKTERVLPLNVLIVDLDNFKEVNDTLGYAVGDIVLKEVVRRFRSCLRDTDCAARVGGDEFMILLPDTRPHKVRRIAEKVRLAVGSAPICLSSGKEIKITASLGVVQVPIEDAPAIDELLAKAHPVLSASKLTGKNRISYEGQGRARFKQHNDHMPEIVAALQRCDQFGVMLQPINRLEDESTYGYECLSRSQVRIFEMPDDFFRVSLENNILTLVDHHCFRTCIAASKSLAPEFKRHVNIFPSSLVDIPVSHLIKAIPAELPKGTFCIEISEQQILGDPMALVEPVQALKDAGCLIAIDDVGFGRSCLETLVLLEPQLIKIDKNLVTGAWQDQTRLKMLSRLLRVTSSLDAVVVAEGIEEKEDLELMRSLGIRYGQGFLWGRPVQLSNFETHRREKEVSGTSRNVAG